MTLHEETMVKEHVTIQYAGLENEKSRTLDPVKTLDLQAKNKSQDLGLYKD